eukprot:scaffold54098_cov19-Tisochrysis_lutea.AAC.6
MDMPVGPRPCSMSAITCCDLLRQSEAGGGTSGLQSAQASQVCAPLLLHRGGVGERVQAVHLAEHSDALARSEGEILRRAVALAEAALDAPGGRRASWMSEAEGRVGSLTKSAWRAGKTGQGASRVSTRTCPRWGRQQALSSGSSCAGRGPGSAPRPG